jgi:uncharacterized membrane protein
MNKVVVCSLLAAAIYGTTPLFERILLKGTHFPLHVGAFARLVPALIVSIVWLFLAGGFRGFGAMAFREWAGFGFLGILGSLVGPYLLFIAYRQHDGNISLIGPLLGTFPLFTIAAGFLFLKETVTAAQWIGIAMILSGSVLVSYR